MEFKVIHIDETASTNQWLREHGDDNDVAVWADFQTAGRGCGTNTWESERGKNLLFSMLTHPVEVPATKQFRISMAASLAIVDALAPYINKVRAKGHERLSIKWPNDIYWADRKLCGILIECQLSGAQIRDCIIGVGLNVNQEVFLSDAPNPVSLWQIIGQATDRETLLRGVLEAFTLDVDTERYRQLLYRRNERHRYRDGNGTFEAELVTVEDDGHLVLRDSEGLSRRYAFKEVSFVI